MIEDFVVGIADLIDLVLVADFAEDPAEQVKRTADLVGQAAGPDYQPVNLVDHTAYLADHIVGLAE